MNFEKKVIDISGKKMKTKKDFILSLSKLAIEILKRNLNIKIDILLMNLELYSQQ
jgi:hypothetical protein